MFAFGDFRLDPPNARLRRGAEVIALTPKAFSVLEHLVAHAGRLVTKDEFMDRVWPGVFVGDAALKVCVRERSGRPSATSTRPRATSKRCTGAATGSSRRSRS